LVNLLRGALFRTLLSLEESLKGQLDDIGARRFDVLLGAPAVDLCDQIVAEAKIVDLGLAFAHAQKANPQVKARKDIPAVIAITKK
jgi:hypothetical protein